MSPGSDLADRWRELSRKGTVVGLTPSEAETLVKHVEQLSTSLRSIAEGALGDAPHQINYNRIREIAADALSSRGLS